MRKIVGKTYNSNIKQFWCKNCKRSVDVIYKDDRGNSYCDKCLPKESKQVEEERIRKENVNECN